MEKSVIRNQGTRASVGVTQAVAQTVFASDNSMNPIRYRLYQPMMYRSGCVIYQTKP